MATGNSVNDEIREQRSKLKGKTTKEKWAYFWEYYKVHTLVAIIAVLVISNFIYTLATRKDSALDAVFVNTYLGQEVDTEQMAAGFIADAGIDAAEYEALIDSSMYIDYEGMDQYSAANMQKLMAMVSARSLDVMVIDDIYMEHNLEAGMFGDLSEMLPADVLEKYADRLLYKDIPEDEKGEVPVGFDVRDSKYMMSDQVPAWFTIVANAPNIENAQKFLEFLLEK